MANAVSKIDDKYFQIAVSEGSEEATIFLYSDIGKFWDYDEDWNRVQVGVTDVEFVRELTKLAKTHQRINVRINSLGGSVVHGAGICAAIQNCAAEVHTFNDGYCASMGAQIWFAAKHRHMASNAILMTHTPSTYLFGNAKQLREAAEMLDKMTESSAIHIANMTGRTKADVLADFFKADKDEWMTFDDCVEKGILTDLETYKTEGVIEGAKQMSVAQIMQKLEQKTLAEQRDRPGLLDQVKQLFTSLAAKNAPVQEEKIPAAAPIDPPAIHAQTTAEMTKADFHQALEDGTLGLAEVAKALEQKGFGVTAPVDPVAAAQQAGSDEFFKKFEAKEAALNAKIDALTQKLEAIAAAPGAARSTPAAPERDPGGIDPQQSFLNDFDQKLIESFESGRSPYQKVA